ncbi:hypothetical protein ACOMHN_032126 [Nucella lapillus]
MNKDKPGRCLLLYGSQTGQSQAIAEEIFQRSSKHGLQPEIFCMSMLGKKFQMEDERCVVMVTSSTGDGEPPDNALKFVRRFNRKTLPLDHLAHVSYTVLGLGDSNYSNFCRNPKDLDRRFSELGAKRFCPSAFADEVEGLDVVADPWIEALLPALQECVGICPEASTPSAEASTTATTQPPDCSLQNGTSHFSTSASTALSHNTASQRDTTDVSETHDDSSNTETLPSQKDDADRAHGTGTSSGHAGQELISDSSLSRTGDDADRAHGTGTSSGHAGQEQISDRSLSRTGDEVQTLETASSQTAGAKHEEESLEKGASETTGGKHVTDLAEAPPEEAEDTLKLNAPDSAAHSLGVSTAALSEKSLTLPALSPAFLTATYLLPDENLSSKMAELPWQNNCKGPSAASDIIKAKVVSAVRLTAHDALKKTLLLKLGFKGNSLTYRPGDSISIICANDDKEVSQLIKRLGLSRVADLPVKVTVMADTKKRRAAVPPHIPAEGASLRYILKHCLDIRHPPKKALLRHLVAHTREAWEQRRLQELCSKEGGEDYTAFVHGEHLSLLDLLYTFPSCHPPLGRLIEHLPRLQPRPYSICSCEQWEPGRLDIAFSVVTIPASHGRLYSRRGLCTGWLDDVTMAMQRHAGKEPPAGEGLPALEEMSLADIEIPIFARTNQHFRTPNDLSLPLIMIGPGTGVAPFIGFLQERQLRLPKEGSGGSVGDAWLLFGCRHKEKDFLFQSAIQEFQEKKVLTKFLPAFSRDAPDSGNNKHAAKYVQDNIRAHAAEICRLAEDRGAVVMVCGDAKHMAGDVAAAFEAVFMQELGVSSDKAKEYVMTMRIRHRYLEDVWT